MAAHGHAARAPSSIRCYVLTLSDTRTEETDGSGRLARELLGGAGFVVTGHRILREEPAHLLAFLDRLVGEASCDVLISTGGTGISRRDGTVDALGGRLEKHIDGFGELFRMLSFAEIGPAAMLSRALAGTVGNLVLFALPGSTGAVRLGLERLILPELGHLVAELGK